MRFAREKTPQMTTPDTPFQIGRAQLFRDGKDVAIIGCGPLMAECLKAAEILEKGGVDAMVINSHTIKPLDKDAILAAAKKTGRVVTVEEHQVTGGLGGAVAEFLAQNHPTPMRFVGVKDRFGESGGPEELLKKFGCTAEDIVKAAKELI
jgi:transketolase